MSLLSQHRFEILSLVVRNTLTTNSKVFQLHGDKQVIAQILPTAPERAYIGHNCYDSSFDLGSIAYTDVLQRLLRLGFQIESSTSGSYSPPKPEKSIIKDDPLLRLPNDTFVLQYTLIRKHLVE
ncbi:unnamed protein product [Rotaria sp. Silwood2]|nr:unnamed protein product [Rotaria sp. Silwood2]CAF2740688.1 unnamed protein product [Rotaria sp. Silwood2]CAF3016298.1 unnamed protein product [Rotaria sp. Silwood2]CAF3916595.1 unnamed protein product [Rotaria sp. Silwood2]CAF4001636.1 unnamed protein product [Rotaria sp. Silwood2]